MDRFYRISRTLGGPALKVLTRVAVAGLEHVPRAGPVILASNHLSNADVIFFGLVVPRQVHYMAKIELWSHPAFWWAVRVYGAFPVRRGGADRAALRTALQLLKQGEVIGLFPEGHRSRTGALQTANPGAALIAFHSGAPVLPAAITGTERPQRLFLTRGRVEIAFGPPFRLEKPSRLTGEALDRGLAEIMGHIAALLPPERRGPWGPVPASSSTAGQADRHAAS